MEKAEAILMLQEPQAAWEMATKVWGNCVTSLITDAFTPEAIDRATRDQERYDAGWDAGVEFAESKQQPLAEAYALVIRDLELDRDDEDTAVALIVLRERLDRLTSG